MSDERIVLKKRMGQKRLGMGLSALLGGMDDVDIFASSSPDVLRNENNLFLTGYSVIDISKIIPNKSQPRKIFNDDELMELSNSIIQNGVLQPILVRKTEDDFFEIIAGERRYRASKLAGLKEMPCIVRDLSEKEVFLIAVIENVQRENLNPLEEAESYSRLIKEFNYTQEDVANLVGKSRSHVANLLRLIKLPEGIKNMVLEGRLSGGHVRPLLSLKTEEQMKSVADVILDNEYSVRKVEELVNLILNDEEKLETLENLELNLDKLATEQKAKMRREIESELIQEIAKAFHEKFEVPIKIKSTKKGGIISIKYKTENELEKIMQNFVEFSKKESKKSEINLPGKDELINISI